MARAFNHIFLCWQFCCFSATAVFGYSVGNLNSPTTEKEKYYSNDVPSINAEDCENDIDCSHNFIKTSTENINGGISISEFANISHSNETIDEVTIRDDSNSTKNVTESPPEEDNHAPLFGFIPRGCPKDDPSEDVSGGRGCVTDDDCWPRVCCFHQRHRHGRNGNFSSISNPNHDRHSNNSSTSSSSTSSSEGYCRMSVPILDRLSTSRVVTPFRSMMAYWQCTPPPPTNYDLFPKPCRTTFDCFPNLCCQEEGRKVCRPPRKSLLTLISNFAEQRESWFG